MKLSQLFNLINKEDIHKLVLLLEKVGKNNETKKSRI